MVISKKSEKAAKVLLSLSKDLLAEIDAYANRHHMSRSEAVRHGIRLLIQNEGTKRE